MSFQQNMPKAAHRNRQAADELEKGHRRDVAGYLYGIAAECAIKEMVTNIPLTSEHSKQEIHYSHFPDLRTLVRDALRGRAVKPLMTFIFDDNFMNNWDISMRYAEAGQIQEAWIDRWRDQARAAVNAMGT